jgi:hypothetical protein
MTRGTDTDNYDGPVSVERFRHLYDARDVRFNIVGAQTGADGANYSQVQIDNGRAAGLVVPATYDFLFYRGESGIEGLERMKHAASFGLPVIPDIEGDAFPLTTAAVVRTMHQARDLLMGMGAGLFWGWYSSKTEWDRITGGTMDFAGDPAWAAGYPFGNGVLPPADFMPDFADLAPFGGLVPHVWQYADTCYDEPTFDMNALNPALLEGSMVRFNAMSDWYSKPEHQTIPAGRTFGVNARADFPGLPANAVALEVEVYLQAGSDGCVVSDGPQNSSVAIGHAFMVPAEGAYMHGRVTLGADGWFQLSAPGRDVKLHLVGVVGYYTV